MMRSDHHLDELKSQIFDICMELDSQSQEEEKKASCRRTRQARRAIEEHFERKRLRKALVDYDFED